MALTPEDVLKKSFGATQFRRGYDEREVDDFLDEVVNELRDLVAQRDDYKRKYEESVKRGGGAVVTKVDDERVAAQAKEIEDLKRQLDQAKSAKPAETKGGGDDKALKAAQSDLAKARQDAEAARADLAKKDEELAALHEELATTREQQAAAPVAAPAEANDGAAKAAGILAMAQQLHDQLVATGETEKNRLIGEASAESQKLVSDAQSRHDELIAEATQRHEALIAEGQQRHKTLIAEATTQHDSMVGEATRKRDEVLRQLEEQRGGLERDIVALRSFETKYKQQLVGFLEGKLHEARNTGALEPKE